MTEYVNEFYLTAAEVNAQEEMPLSRLVTLIIDTATGHANSLGFGYAHMMETNTSWVLSRLSVDIKSMPGVNRAYRLITWVSSVNRIYSERLFELKDAATDETLAWAHTTWMAIDMDSRRPTDLSRHQALVDIVTEREFGGDKGGKLLTVGAEASGATLTSTATSPPDAISTLSPTCGRLTNMPRVVCRGLRSLSSMRRDMPRSR